MANYININLDRATVTIEVPVSVKDIDLSLIKSPLSAWIQTHLSIFQSIRLAKLQSTVVPVFDPASGTFSNSVVMSWDSQSCRQTITRKDFRKAKGLPEINARNCNERVVELLEPMLMSLTPIDIYWCALMFPILDSEAMWYAEYKINDGYCKSNSPVPEITLSQFIDHVSKGWDGNFKHPIFYPIFY